MTRWLKTQVAGWLFLLCSAWTHAQPAADFNALPRMALVVSNSQLGGKLLPSSANNAEAMAGALKVAGFSVQRETDLTSAQFENVVTHFSRRAAQARAFSLVYLAGKGTTDGDSIRFFVSTEKPTVSQEDVYRDSTALAWVLAEMAVYRQAAGSSAPIALIADIDTKLWGTAEDVQLPNVEAAYGALQRESRSMVMLPNVLGMSARLTDDSQYGLFTKHLAEAFTTKGANIGQLFGKAAIAVRRDAKRPTEPELIVKGLEIQKTVFLPAELTDDPKARGRSARVM